MRLLLVAATEREISPLLAGLGKSGIVGPQLTRFQNNTYEIDVLVTGVGMVATATWISRILATGKYDAAINAGICGSFDRTLILGEVVCVQHDCMPELGAEDGAQFISIHEMNLLGKNEFPYVDGLLHGSEAEVFGSLNRLRKVSGITVNRVHGNENSIAHIVARVNAQTESMEGAAFLYACLVAGVPALQIRAISNYVEKRNRAAWRIDDAVSNLNTELLKFFGKK